MPLCHGRGHQSAGARGRIGLADNGANVENVGVWFTIVVSVVVLLWLPLIWLANVLIARKLREPVSDQSGRVSYRFMTGMSWRVRLRFEGAEVGLVRPDGTVMAVGSTDEVRVLQPTINVVFMGTESATLVFPSGRRRRGRTASAALARLR